MTTFFCSSLSSFSDHAYLSVDELIPSIEQVVGVPVTLNGDLKNQFVETTVGFDTICKVGAAELHHYASTQHMLCSYCFMVLYFLSSLYIAYYVFCTVVFTINVSYYPTFDVIPYFVCHSCSLLPYFSMYLSCSV